MRPFILSPDVEAAIVSTSMLLFLCATYWMVGPVLLIVGPLCRLKARLAASAYV